METIVAAETEILITLTADIVSAHVSHNSVSTTDVAGLIETVYGALGALGAPAAPEEEKPKGAVSIRASIKPDHLISMIDGKAYKMLKRHLSRNGYTPESYREVFDLPRDYPMVAATYAQQRRTLAKTIGLGTQAEKYSREHTGSTAAETGAQAPEQEDNPRPARITGQMAPRGIKPSCANNASSAHPTRPADRNLSPIDEEDVPPSICREIISAGWMRAWDGVS